MYRLSRKSMYIIHTKPKISISFQNINTDISLDKSDVHESFYRELEGSIFPMQNENIIRNHMFWYDSNALFGPETYFEIQGNYFVRDFLYLPKSTCTHTVREHQTSKVISYDTSSYDWKKRVLFNKQVI